MGMSAEVMKRSAAEAGTKWRVKRSIRCSTVLFNDIEAESEFILQANAVGITVNSSHASVDDRDDVRSGFAEVLRAGPRT